MRICIGCSRVEYFTKRGTGYLEAICKTWPGAKLLIPARALFRWKNQNDLAQDLRSSDVLTLLEFEGHIDKMQYQQYRQARKMKIPIYVFRDGFFLKVVRARMINWSDEKRRYARLTIASGGETPPRPAKLY